MHEPIKRAIAFSLITIATLFLLLLILKPNPVPRAVIDILSIATTMRDFLYSFRPFVIVLAPAGTGSIIRVLVPSSLSSSSRALIMVPSIEIEERELNITVIYQGENSLSRIFAYSIIVLPSSKLIIPKDIDFSDRRTIIIHDDGDKLRIELVPYYNYSLMDYELVVDLFLFKCSLKLKERMNMYFLGYMELVTYLRSYENIGSIEVLLNGQRVLREYAKVIILRVHYEVWDIG